MYQPTTEPQAEELQDLPADPLAEVLQGCHEKRNAEAGLAVEPRAEQVVTEAALDVELLGFAVQPRAERVVPKVPLVVLARGAPEAALAVEHFGLALQILPKHADPLAEELWRGADGTVAPMLVPPVLEVLLTRMNARHHRSAPRSPHMYTDSRHLQAFARPQTELKHASQPA